MFAFLAVAALVIVVPGQDTALTIRNTLGGGRRAGIATACGVACGLATWAVATAFGLAAILVASEPVYLALKAFGAAYLLWLGACCLWRAIRREAAGDGRGSIPAPFAASGVPPGDRLESRQREDRGVLHEPPAAVHSDGRHLPDAARARAALLPAHARRGSRATRPSSHARRTSSTGHAPGARSMPSPAPCSSRSGSSSSATAAKPDGRRPTAGTGAGRGCYHPARSLRDRLMVGRRILVPEVGVRVPVPQLAARPRKGAFSLFGPTTLVTANPRIL